MTVYIEGYDPTISQHGFNTAKAARFESTVAFTGVATFSGAPVFTGGVDASASALKFKRNVLASSGNTTMTAAMSGSVMLIDGASTDYLLPAITSADVGMNFLFVSTIISTGTQTITAGAADLLTGGVAIIDVGAVGSDFFAPDVSDDLILTMNGTTTGGVAVGSWVQYTAISDTRWFVQGVLCGSGTLATPFS